MNEWISVKDRLPEINVDVLVFDKNISLKYVAKIIEDENSNGILCKFFIPFPYDVDFSHGNVTHWMPLPEPPK